MCNCIIYSGKHANFKMSDVGLESQKVLKMFPNLEIIESNYQFVG